MDFDFFLQTNAFLNKEIPNLASVVALKLDYGAPLRMLVGSTIATPQLFEKLQNFLQVQIVWQALHQSKALSGGSLLEMQIYTTYLE